MTRATKVHRCVDFLERILALELTLPWRVLVLVTIDGVQPGRLDGEERELARLLFGDVEEIDPRLRRIIVWRLGRAAGKTTIAAGVCIYCAWTVTLRSGRGHIPTAFFVAPGSKLAKIGAGVARELVRGSSLERYVEDDVADGFTMRRPDGRLVAIRCVAASRGGANLRGVDVIVLVLDESEFFASGDDGDYAVNDRDQISAAMPRLVGFVLCVSTPWPTENATAAYFDKNFAHPVDAVAAIGPSNLMRPTEQLLQDIAREALRDEEDAQREFFCITGMRGGSRLYVEGLKEAIIEGRPLSIAAPDGAVIGCGGDLGLERDSSSIAIVARVEDLYELAEFDEIRPAKGQPLSPRHVIRDRFAPIMRRHGAQAIALDIHYRQSAIDHLTDAGLDFEDAPGGAQGKYDTYMFTRSLIRSGKLRLPNSPRLIAQLRAVTSTPMPGGGTRITSPRRAGGGHGDVVSGLVLACWQAGGSPTGKRVPGLGLLRYYQQLAAAESNSVQSSLPDPPPPRSTWTTLRLPPRFIGCSLFTALSGTPYNVEAGRILADPRDVEDLERLGFTHP